jgi:biotin synthase-like enzyme
MIDHVNSQPTRKETCLNHTPVIRHDWTLQDIQTLYEMPFMDLLFQAQQIHRACFEANTLQISTLLNIKKVAARKIVNGVLKVRAIIRVLKENL